MPYKLIRTQGGERTEIKPLACDSPKSPYQYEDKRIERKAKTLCAKLNKRHADSVYSVEHY